MTADRLTVLTSVNRRLASKTFSQKKDGTIQNRSYGNEKYFSVTAIEVAGIGELARALEGLSRNPHAFVVRGEPLPGIDRKRTRRLLHPDRKTGEPATFTEAPRRWALVDVDKIACPAAIDPKSDPGGAVEYVLGLLPPELHDAWCWWQLSSSQSVFSDTTISMHLWVWLDAPLGGDELKRWAIAANQSAGYKLIDPALFSAVQAHYVAAPDFVAPLPDPLPRRCGLRQGLDDSVSLIIPPPHPKRRDEPGTEGYDPGRGVKAYLDMIGGPMGFREPIKKAIASYIAIHGSGADCGPLKAAIREALDRAEPDWRNDPKGARYIDDEHLDAIIDAIRAFQGDKPGTGGPPPPPPPPRNDFATLDELIDHFNSRYAVVNEAGKTLIYESVMDPILQRRVLVRIAFEDLKKMYCNRMHGEEKEVTINGKPQLVTEWHTWANWWLAHRRRRQYLGGVVFDPTDRAPPNCWNLWTGFKVEPKAGDWHLMRQHVRRVICGGDPEVGNYLLDTCARMFQFPDRPGEVATVLRGPKGCGKGIFLNYLCDAWGAHGIHISNPAHLVGNFNAHLRDCIMLFADEAFFAADRQHEGVLKALVTEPTLPIEGKYQNVVSVANLLHVFMASNSDWVVPASLVERRWFVPDVPDTRCGDLPYFKAIADEMERGGLAAMIWDFLHRDISAFEPREVPQTQGLRDQKLHSLDSLHRWWLAVLSRGFVWKSRHGAPWFRDWHPVYTTELLWRSYLQWCAETRPFDRKPQPFSAH